MAQVGHRGGPKRAFGTLEVETVGAESGEDDADVLQVLRPRGAIYQYIIENTRTNLRRYGRRTSFINAWKVAGALERPKGITKNS